MNVSAIPRKIHWHKASQLVEIHYGAEPIQLSAEFLRVFSPSLEGQEKPPLPAGKKNIKITALKQVGHYALGVDFADQTRGIYHWDYLYELCNNQAHLWQDYLEELKARKESRDPDLSVVRILN